MNGFFAEPLHDYTVRCLGGPVTLLQAGCLAPLRELGIGKLAEDGFEISVTAVDADHPLTKRALDDIRREVADLTIMATEKVTRKTLNEADQRRLVEEALGELDFSSLSSEAHTN